MIVKFFIKFMFVILAIVLVKTFGLSIGGFVICLLLVAGIWLWPILEDELIITELNGRIDHVYIVGGHPETKQDAEIPGLEKVIVTCKHHKVEKTKKKYLKLLERSKNEQFHQPGLSKENRLSVKTYVFDDATRKGESWEHYLEFVGDDIKDDRVNRHTALQKADSVFYAQWGNHQAGVFYQKMHQV